MNKSTARLASLPANERPRERMATLGPEALSDRELMALVLRNGREGASALDIAGELLAEYGSLHAIAAARLEELTRWPGVGEAKAAALIAAFRLGRRAEQVDGSGLRLRGPADVARIAAQELQGLRRERVIVLVCDGANRLKKVVRVSEGSIDRAMLPVREILNAVLVNDGRAFAVAHNHPSGHTEASQRDARVTSDLAKAATATGVRLLGHVIVGGGRWSTAQAGALT
ncbi:MAG: DNA repair protein RadC [Actinomycetota bacterium]